MVPSDLSANYPVLYHIVWGGSWPSIRENGLLSSKALLRLYGKSDSEIAGLTQSRRPHRVEIECSGRPRAVLRDQKPLTDAGLRSALSGSAEPWQWYDRINCMVFFWPTKERLKTMISASVYERVDHDVLVIDTKKLVDLEAPNIRLSRMNSGSTKPFAHRRDMGLFKRIEDYPFEFRRKRYGTAKAVAEVCVLDRVENIREAVLEVKRGSVKEILTRLSRH